MSSAWSLWPTSIVSSVLRRILLLLLLAWTAWIGIVAISMIALISTLVWGEKALRGFVLSRNADTSFWLVYLFIPCHDSEPSSFRVVSPLSTIHRRTFDFQRFSSALLVCVNGLRWHLGHGLKTSICMSIRSLWLLATPSKIVTSVSEHLIVTHNLVDSIISLRLAHTLKCSRRRSHWLRSNLLLHVLLMQHRVLWCRYCALTQLYYLMVGSNIYNLITIRCLAD